MEADSSLKIDLKLFASYFGPMLVSFIGSRVIAQTDIIMLAPLGPDAVGAYSVPSRVMILDMIVALALGPVVSITMAKARDSDQRNKVINSVLSAGVYLGLFLTLFGLIVYPYVVEHLISDRHTVDLAQEAVFYLTLAIPLRMAQFLGLMLIHGDGRGRVVVPLVLFTVVANAGLNWVFIYLLGYGFSGCYFATIITAAIELVIIIWVLSKPGERRSFLCIPDRHWLIGMVRKGGAEWGRLVSYQVVSLATLAIFAMSHNWEGRLEVFSLATELQALLLMPMIAVMRSTAIILATRQVNQTLCQIILSLREVLSIGLLVTFTFSAVILLTDDQLWHRLYGVTSEALVWWHPFLVILAVTMPLTLLNSFQRGAWQARERYGFLFAVDFFVQWLILLPCVFIGIYVGNPWLTWSGWLFSELVSSFVYFLRRKELVVRDEPQILDDRSLLAQPAGANGK